MRIIVLIRIYILVLNYTIVIILYLFILCTIYFKIHIQGGGD